jgi:hypothetical protein
MTKIHGLKKFMNLTKLISSAAIAAAIFFGSAAAAPAQTFSGYPLVKLNISGTYYFTANPTNTQKVPLQKFTYNTQALINLLNASPNATNLIQMVTHTTSQIPKGSYFLWDVAQEELYITNKNGFFFPLLSTNYGFHDFGYLAINETNLIGTVKYSSKVPLEGSETDKTGIEFYFNDGGDGGPSKNQMHLFGVATLNWTYGKPAGGNQKASLSVKMSGNGNGTDVDYLNNFNAIPTTFSASGSGSIASMPTDYQPFFTVYP